MSQRSKQTGQDVVAESGTWTTVAAVDVVQTKLRRVLEVLVTPQDDMVAGAAFYQGVPSGLEDGKFTLKGWGTGFAAAATFGKRVTYVAYGY